MIPVHLDLPAPDAPYHYRLVTAIALAEVARRLDWGKGRDRPVGA